MKVICDVVFSVAALIVIAYGFITEQLTMGEFLIAIMINYIGMRYLIMSDIDLRLTELEFEAMIEQQQEEE
jgi:hypothetical protein